MRQGGAIVTALLTGIAAALFVALMLAISPPTHLHALLKLHPWYGWLVFLERWGCGRFQWLRQRLGGHWERYKAPRQGAWSTWQRLKPRHCTRQLPGMAMGDRVDGDLECEET